METKCFSNTKRTLRCVQGRFFSFGRKKCLSKCAGKSFYDKQNKIEYECHCPNFWGVEVVNIYTARSKIPKIIDILLTIYGLLNYSKNNKQFDLC